MKPKHLVLYKMQCTYCKKHRELLYLKNNKKRPMCTTCLYALLDEFAKILEVKK